MHFQVYFPGVQGSDRKHLDAVGLGDLYVRGLTQFVPAPGDRTPDGSTGMCAAWPAAGQPMGCQPDKQTWTPGLPNEDGEIKYHVGFWNDHPVRPADLQRSSLLPGASAELGDHKWLIPQYQRLPSDVTPTGDGQWTLTTKPRFEPLVAMARQWLHVFQADGEGSFLWAEAAEAALTLLKLNYRIIPEVASHLGLFDTQTVLRPVLVFLGLPADAFETAEREEAA